MKGERRRKVRKGKLTVGISFRWLDFVVVPFFVITLILAVVRIIQVEDVVLVGIHDCPKSPKKKTKKKGRKKENSRRVGIFTQG